ncbi:AI-2E family transporter [Massilia sp. R2A-15]|uniref:AI-2E family transporter n=1 Tax=Massilia sp. R2A-15 TaxID=3064278 RepID=UPI0027326518|nr:AI-2E family transporter [Massilia sp. R2A-15]WLI88473.1 AI-2E family transporter [Massilia sp. R2A-15]
MIDPSTNKTDSEVGRRTLRIELAPKTLFTIVAMVVAVALLTRLVPVILVLIAALMLVGTLNPTVEALERRKINRNVAIGVVFAAMLVVLGLLGVFTVPALVEQVASLVQQEPKLRAQLVKFLSSYPLTGSLAESLRSLKYAALFKSYSAEAMALSKDLFEIVAYGAGAFFLALYIMIDRDRLRGALYAAIPRAHHIKLSRILLNLETIVGGYVRGQVITCAMMAIFLFVLLTACGVPNAVAIAAFGGIADVLPFIGIFLTMIPAVLAALATSSFAATVVFVLLLCYEEFESRVLIPIVYGRALRLPSSIVLFALIAGGTLYGIAGALLALPVAATLLMLIDELKVEMPGETAQAKDDEIEADDVIGEEEYLRRTDGMPAEAAAGIALEISEEKKLQEDAAQKEDGVGSAGPDPVPVSSSSSPG